jgi:hypothetical protein
MLALTSRILPMIFWMSMLAALPGYAKSIYVDQTLESDCSGRYDPSAPARRCGPGSEEGVRDLATGLASMRPGDTLILRAGVYGQIRPHVSGAPGQPITIRSHEHEIARIVTAGGVGLTMDKKAHMVIEGLAFSEVGGFGHIYDCNNILIRDCSFSGSIFSGTTGALKLVRSTHCRVLNDTFGQGAGDLLILQDNSDRNIIAGNVFDTARHSLMSIRCSNFNVVRNNTFRNPRQKAIEIYDCEGTSDAPIRVDATKRNLIEGNTFALTASSDRIYKFNAIQHGGQDTIVRRNVFSNCEGGGVNFQSYAIESVYVYGNRLYNNTFYNNRCYAIIGNSGDGREYFDNVVKNNLLYKNSNCSGGGDQVSVEDSSSVVLSGNALATLDPGFINESGKDFRLSATSPHVDRAAYATRAVGFGSGTTLKVDDAGYFYDGFGIPGEAGDLVQFHAQDVRARILRVDYANNILTLDAPLSWSAGQNLHLAYSGDAPDVGAFEYSSTGHPAQTAP